MLVMQSAQPAAANAVTRICGLRTRKEKHNYCVLNILFSGFCVSYYLWVKVIFNPIFSRLNREADYQS
jgi:hypothetical protein